MISRSFLSTILWLIILPLIYCALIAAVFEPFILLVGNTKENARQVVATLKDILNDEVVMSFLQSKTLIKTEVLLFIVFVKLLMGLFLVALHLFGIMALWRHNDSFCIIYTVVISSTVWIDLHHQQLKKLNVLICLLLIIYIVVEFYFSNSEVKEEEKEDSKILVKVDEADVENGGTESELETVGKL